MEKEKSTPKIWEGKKKVFLVCDDSFKGSDAPFLRFLRNEGYTCGTNKGNYGCCWVYVDITTKQYAYGMPGVALTEVIGNHAITIDEFIIIYEIFKKYENKELFIFYENRFDYNSRSSKPINDPVTYEKISDVVKEINADAKKIRLSLGTVDYDAPYLLHYDVTLNFSAYCDAKKATLDFLSRIDMLQTITIWEQDYDVI